MKATDFTLAGYPGAKTRLAAEIARRLLPATAWGVTQYRDPFVGMGAVLPYIYGRFPNIWINDLHPALACMWLAIREHPERLQMAVSRIWPIQTAKRSTYWELTNELVSALQGNVIDIANPEHMVKYGAIKLILHRISFNSLGEVGRSVVGGRLQLNQTVRHRFNLRKIHQAIRFHHVGMRRSGQVRITCADGLNLVTDNAVRAAIYCDPVYMVKGNTLYRFRWTEDDHTRLRDTLVSSSHWWLCSYDENHRVTELYKGCRFESFSISRKVGHNGYKRRGVKKVNSELLLSPRHS